MAWAVWSVAGLVASVSLSALAAEPIPADAVPTPPERPAGLLPTPLTEPAPQPPARPAELTPAAPPKASEDAAAPTAMPVPPPSPPERPADLSGEAALALKVAAPDDEACRVRLKRLGVAFEPLPPIAEGQCTAPLPLKVTALADGVALKPAATLTCRVAESLARWTTEVQVAAQRTFGHPLTGLEIGGSYVCRGQNHDLDAKLSEHAFADAVDIMAFSVEGLASIPVGATPQDQPAGAFLQTSRASACPFFRTVLGPGSNAAHANHLHFDERERTAGHRLCQ